MVFIFYGIYFYGGNKLFFTMRVYFRCLPRINIGLNSDIYDRIDEGMFASMDHNDGFDNLCNLVLLISNKRWTTCMDRNNRKY